jgi:dTDP-4-dehydrorhamnose reductase
VKVLVTGAGGQLGVDLLDVYAEEDVIGLTHAELDVADEAAVVATVAEHAPDLVINAAAWTAVDACEEDEDRAHRVNALGPWWLAQACDRFGATLLHVSTDYVFSGDAPRSADGSPRPWSEFDPIAPVNAYGRSKAAGEELVRSTLGPHHIVRTSWVNGARGSNFVRTMLRLGEERDELDVVDDEVGSPTFTRDLASAIRELAGTGRYGTVHLTNQGTCSWYELACAAFELAGVEVEVRRTTAARFARPAPRPSWSVLSDRHARTTGLSPLPPWRDGLARLVAELEAVADPAAAQSSSG